MRALQILCFIFLIPLLAVLGHDAYITYQDKVFDQPMKFTELGWLWTTYAGDSHDWAQQNISADSWKVIIVPLLKTRSWIVAGVPFVFFLSLILLCKGFEMAGARTLFMRAIGRGASAKEFVSKGEQKKTKFKYNRK